MAKESVLIIDDDGWLAEQHVRQLAHAGFRPHHVRNALEGIEAIDLYKPDVIILDIFMPGPNGIVLLHEIRSHSDLANIPVIVCSNSASDIPHGNLTKYGVRTVLDKATMHPEDVSAAVRKVLI
jgi:DNA-binding response OmpR family regulator